MCLTFRKIFFIGTVFLFVTIFIAGLVKNSSPVKTEVTVLADLLKETKVEETKVDCPLEEKKIDRVWQLFSKGSDKLPIVETIHYTTRVPWLKGRSAWISNYASYYQTSRHFIARSLNGKKDYFTQKVFPGDRFNVFRTDKKIKFYLLVDLETCTMDFYYLDLDKEERVFLKTYQIGVGRKETSSPSGSLTPTGKYLLGSKVAIYKPEVEGLYRNQRIQMMDVFGTRWIPFAEELENCSDQAKGYGIHGIPCKYDFEKNCFVEEEKEAFGYNSDGCLRLKREDIEEIFSIVVTKESEIEIVKSKKEAKLPMLREQFFDDDK